MSKPLLLALLLAACAPAEMGAPSADPADAAPADPDADPDPDPDPTLTITPTTFTIATGETIEIAATGATTSIVWASSDPSVARVIATDSDSATIFGWAEGTATISASAGTIGAVSTGGVLGLDYATCCRQDTDNFCNLAPATGGCPMTAAGGYCDPNGDGSYSELGDAEWQLGWAHYADVCEPYLEAEGGGGQCDAPLPQSDSGAATCDPSEQDSWRCALSPQWGGAAVSQVCRDLGAGPRWYTFNVEPDDCCACAGDFSQACCAAGSDSDGC